MLLRSYSVRYSGAPCRSVGGNLSRDLIGSEGGDWMSSMRIFRAGEDSYRSVVGISEPGVHDSSIFSVEMGQMKTSQGRNGTRTEEVAAMSQILVWNFEQAVI